MAAKATRLALASLVLCICQFGFDWALKNQSTQPKKGLSPNYLLFRNLFNLSAVLTLIASGSLVVDQSQKYPLTNVYASNSSVSMGTSIAAIVVGVPAIFLWIYVVFSNFGGTQENYTPRLFQSGVVIAVMAAIFFGFAIENDHWTWEGDKLVTKDDWEDCDSYMEGICETMDQWDEKKC